MNGYTIGVDITTISRFKNKGSSFIKKVLSEEEILEYNVSKNKPRFLAVHWSIKEAIFKVDNKYSNFKDINIIKENKRYKHDEFEITTSCEADTYISIVRRIK
ncbi:MAG: 4'-phosphopantetheinyl transferase superfamily protein [Mycoplasma sp.]|nr:4'-phosphopantetheinyl transferase superfamily protein [Mycoplasma sp.]